MVINGANIAAVIVSVLIGSNYRYCFILGIDFSSLRLVIEMIIYMELPAVMTKFMMVLA